MKIINFIKKSSVVALSLALAACGNDGTKNNAPEISNASVPSAQEMEFFEYRVKSLDIEQQELTYTVSGLPAWANTTIQTIEAVESEDVNVTPNRIAELIIFGTPTYDDAGISTVFVSVSDGINESHADPIRIDVENTNREPTLQAFETERFNELAEVTISIAASDADGDEVSLYVYGLPAWLNFDEKTSSISGFSGCEAEGRYDEIVVEMSDGVSTIKDETLAISIIDTVTESRCFSGKVLGGDYINKAVVFLDINNNHVFDEGEPSTTSSEEGDYILVVSDEYIIEKERPEEDPVEGEEDEESNLPVYDNYVKYPSIRALITAESADNYHSSTADFNQSPVTLTADPMLTVPKVLNPITHEIVDKIDYPGYHISPFTDAGYQIFSKKIADRSDMEVTQALYDARYELLDNFFALTNINPNIRAISESDILAVSVGSLKGHETILRALYGDYVGKLYPLGSSFYETPVTEHIYQAMYETGNVVVSNKGQLVEAQGE